MVASPANIESRPSEVALELIDSMQILLQNAEWQRIEKLVLRVRNVVLELPEDERLPILTAMNNCIERVRSEALVSRANIKDKLSEIQRGRVATQAYGQSHAVSA